MIPFAAQEPQVVEAKKLGIRGIGIEANPIAHFLSTAKTDWNIDPDTLLSYAATIAENAVAEMRSQGISDYEGSNNPAVNTSYLRHLAPQATDLLLKGIYQPPTAAQMFSAA